MGKFEISLASNYVPTWTVVDAIRELYQNALDQEAQDPYRVASWYYSDGRLTICNAHSKLTPATLLLGGTSKASDERTIGQFGEGYKIAALVLLREGKGMVIYNTAVQEVWTPRMVKSRRFGGEVLTFFTEKLTLFNKESYKDDLTIEVTGITQEEWDEAIVPSNLHLQPDYEVIHDTQYGEIIKQPGMVFVNGLYVCKYDPYKYGYNFKPGQIKLDRDRKLVSDFDLRWMASKMWAGLPDVINLIEKGIPDVQYVDSFLASDLSEIALERFRLMHGPHAVPVTTQAELDAVPVGYTGYIVPSSYRSLIIKASGYEAPPEDEDGEDPTPLRRLGKWYDRIKASLSYTDRAEFEEIYKEMKDNEDS